MQFIIHNKWIILCSCEIAAWFCSSFMVYFRYFAPQKHLFWISTIARMILGYVPHLSIPIMIAIHEKSIHALLENKNDLLFILVVISLLVASFTLGKRYLLHIDRLLLIWAKKRQKRKRKNR